MPKASSRASAFSPNSALNNPRRRRPVERSARVQVRARYRDGHVSFADADLAFGESLAQLRVTLLA